MAKPLNFMRIRFTKHALEKFSVLKRHGVLISRNKVLQTVTNPRTVDKSRLPLLIAQSDLQRDLVLRVVYRVESGKMVVITFYPGRKSQYGKE